MTQDNQVTPFHLEARPVRGRIVRLGSVLDDIVSAHTAPETVSRSLGEAIITAIIAGSSLKFEGRVIVQASGNGPISFVISDYTSDGGVRGYIRADINALPGEAQPDLSALMGDGQFALTIDPGTAAHRYQGIAALEGESFAKTVETYFIQSEQLPSRLILAIARHTDQDGQTKWRGGGILIQRIATSDADTNEDGEDPWVTALALINTISADELTDPTITEEDVLYRLFHEEGVRTFAPQPIHKRCTCTPDRLRDILKNFTRKERAEMVTDSGEIEMTCEYCVKTFCFDPKELGPSTLA